MQPLPPKKEVALALLERSSVHVHLDPRIEGVVVPPWFKKQPQLVLQIGLNMPVPIPDLRLDDESMSCTLSFSRSPFFCVVPWKSVFAMVGDDARGMVWPDDVPREVAHHYQVRTAAEPVPAVGARKEQPPPAPRPKLEAAPPPSSKDAGAPSSKPKKGRKKPALAPVPAESEAAPPTPVPQPAPAAARPATLSGDDANTGARPARPTPEPAPASKKPKRELPPYLRVVK